MLKNKSKDRDSNFLVMFSLVRPEVEGLMLVTIRDDTWNTLNMQHMTPNSKTCDYKNLINTFARSSKSAMLLIPTKYS